MQIIPLPAGVYVRTMSEHHGGGVVDTPVFWVKFYEGNDLRPDSSYAVDGAGEMHKLIEDQCQLVWTDRLDVIAEALTTIATGRA